MNVKDFLKVIFGPIIGDIIALDTALLRLLIPLLFDKHLLLTDYWFRFPYVDILPFIKILP